MCSGPKLEKDTSCQAPWCPRLARIQAPCSPGPNASAEEARHNALDGETEAARKQVILDMGVVLLLLLLNRNTLTYKSRNILRPEVSGENYQVCAAIPFN